MSYRTHKDHRQQRARARRLPPAERRAHLLMCALRVFARRGLGEARHAEIAKEAQVSVPTVFFYFPTRTDLVNAVLDEVTRFYYEMTEQELRGQASLSQKLQNLAATYAASVDTHPDYARVALDWSTATRNDVWPRYLDLQRRVVQLLTEVITRGRGEGHFAAGVNAEDMALLLVGTSSLIIQMKFAGQPPERVDRFLHTLMQVALGEVPP